ncbi:hypothetical protein FGK63_01085 [Ruegeria sediminis]|uniref:Uncharacterized protein n=1 Tax=Ruegeria sediminis TaxID=2583820 RepID=A0ABY2X2T0_9RHOB|nr:hypothetical protein [Ruegeria sediminis]TMV09694.1 hypothetical protein FGK63_01085 [Ruegeria sediminis]
MAISNYTRPSKTPASAVGEKNRARWSLHFRKKLLSLIEPVEFLTAEEDAANDAHKYPWGNRRRWVSIRIRADQMAAIELLQKRHLKATGKEISRAEVLWHFSVNVFDAETNYF